VSLYIKKTDADRLTDKLKAMLAGLEAELYRAIEGRIAEGLTPSEARAAADAEVAAVLKAVDQVEAALHAELDGIVVDIDDDDDGEAL
jgi:hypothetical protein